MAIYMHYEGIEGNVTAKGYEKWIEVNSFQFGSGRGITTPTGRAANRESSAPSISEVVVTKTMDKASPMLFQEGLVGMDGKVVKVVITRTGKEMEELCAYKFEDVLVSGYSVSTGGDAPSESLSLNFVKFEYNYKGSDAAGAKGGPVKVAYDIGAAKTM
ncbi:type VI secretion system tube protein Hcp [Elioraea tepidiphila]|jgi:type VI secretion system secreted protein Hcp|uniref:Hcp family type VI secretion system effector n=1 Tax=Elioraea tepidiphila TaxID=457934 RepID=UPI00037C4BAD|nr:type VI secretion system tube protein Hcp [Elioraea tepidiphila]